MRELAGCHDPARSPSRRVGGRYALVRCCQTSGKIRWKYFFAKKMLQYFKKCWNIFKNVAENILGP
jgi:hypothetical protein